MNCDACLHVLTTVTTFVHTNWPNPLIFKAFCVAAFKVITLTGWTEESRSNVVRHYALLLYVLVPPPWYTCRMISVTKDAQTQNHLPDQCTPVTRNIANLSPIRIRCGRVVSPRWVKQIAGTWVAQFDALNMENNWNTVVSCSTACICYLCLSCRPVAARRGCCQCHKQGEQCEQCEQE